MFAGQPLVLSPHLSDRIGKEALALGGAVTVESPRRWFAFICLTLTVVFNAAAHGVVYTYLFYLLNELGWSGERISLAWNIGVVTEIVMFLLFARLRRRFTLWFILRASFGGVLINGCCCMAAAIHG